jgi:hypothetical protein
MNRTLRPSIQTLLEVITGILSILLISINDFSIGALPVILLAVGVVAFNLTVLERFGKL